MRGRWVWMFLPLLVAACAVEDESAPPMARSLHSTMERHVLADAVSGCKARRLPNSAPMDDVTWNGACADGFSEGEGTMLWYRRGKLAQSDFGHFHAGLMEGEGTRVLADGTRYSGQWRAGLREGDGGEVWADGTSYVGHWRAGRLSGQGVLRTAEGQLYRGEFRDGRRNGQGEQTWPSGDIYKGEWRDDRRDGRGSFTWKDGSRFEGDWKDGEPQGKGSLFVDTNGTRYENWDYHE